MIFPCANSSANFFGSMFAMSGGGGGKPNGRLASGGGGGSSGRCPPPRAVPSLTPVGTERPGKPGSMACLAGIC